MRELVGRGLFGQDHDRLSILEHEGLSLLRKVALDRQVGAPRL